jgi:hypothetical protein
VNLSIDLMWLCDSGESENMAVYYLKSNPLINFLVNTETMEIIETWTDDEE